MEAKDRIRTIIDELLPICESWIQKRNGQLFFIDPNDDEEISAHYGATHIAATLILYGMRNGDGLMSQKGLTMLDSILNRWSYNNTLPDFHYDFNNFSLCVIADAIKDSEPFVYQRIQQTILQTSDSNHDTTNWLPMRWFVNKKRYEWTSDYKYNQKCKLCRSGIEKATNADGGIEDRLPKGVSFNLQYDVATVATLQFLRCRGENYELQKELEFLLNAVSPDGDVNYQGRGCNQIFAWGLWIYLLASTGRIDELEKTFAFIIPTVYTMFKNHNLMLNEFDGTEKYLWWDYHYCSVYCAHFLFWLTLALLDYEKLSIALDGTQHGSETGLHIHQTKEHFVVSFDGRNEYLAEKGPIVNAIWTKKYGMLYKGSFGPWQGMFGKKYGCESVLRNFCGLIEIKSNENHLPSLLKRIAHRLEWRFSSSMTPLFSPVLVEDSNESLVLEYSLKRETRAFFNIPILGLEDRKLCMSLQVDGRPVHMFEVGSIKNQYGWCRLYHSREVEGKNWKLSIK